jgi:hypothetical protein
MTATEKFLFIVAFVCFAVCASIVIVKTTLATMPETRRFDAGSD